MVALPKTRPTVAPTEVSPRPKRRLFTPEYKRKILEEAAACSESGETGALLRREGLYSSHLSDWRRARDAGELDARKQRGPKARVPDARDQTIVDLERDLRRQRARADRAEALVELQKKLAELLSQASDEPNARSR